MLNLIEIVSKNKLRIPTILLYTKKVRTFQGLHKKKNKCHVLLSNPYVFFSNLTALELMKPPTFHMQGVSLDLKSMMLSMHCSLGEVNVKGIYSAFNENLYNLVPVLSEGHVV